MCKCASVQVCKMNPLECRGAVHSIANYLCLNVQVCFALRWTLWNVEVRCNALQITLASYFGLNVQVCKMNHLKCPGAVQCIANYLHTNQYLNVQMCKCARWTLWMLRCGATHCKLPRLECASVLCLKMNPLEFRSMVQCIRNYLHTNRCFNV